VIPLRWVSDALDLNSAGLEFLAFEPPSHSIRAIFKNPVTKDSMLVTREVFAAIITQVKAQATRKFSNFIYSFTTLSCMDRLIELIDFE
jgi:hypothetical protein